VSNEPRHPLGDGRTAVPEVHPPGFDREWASDELAIDFPSIAPAVERIRASMLRDEAEVPLRAEVRISLREAIDGVTLPLDVPVRGACPLCGGRGETWMEACRACAGTGDSLVHHRVRLSVPAGVSDGARFRFRVSSPLAAPTRVEVHIAVS
jgi:DnaJ-class molecular chaperone